MPFIFKTFVTGGHADWSSLIRLFHLFCLVGLLFCTFWFQACTREESRQHSIQQEQKDNFTIIKAMLLTLLARGPRFLVMLRPITNKEIVVGCTGPGTWGFDLLGQLYYHRADTIQRLWISAGTT